jgi:hypothetical protein
VKVLLLILAYYRICDGYILIYDPLVKESIDFIQDKLEILVKQTHLLNILLIANIRFSNVTDIDKLKEVKKLFTVRINNLGK